MHTACLDLSLARDSAGNSTDARIAMIAVTTNNSISVNPVLAISLRRIHSVFFMRPVLFQKSYILLEIVVFCNGHVFCAMHGEMIR